MSAALGGSSAHGNATPYPRALRCEFYASTSARWENDQPKAELNERSGGMDSLLFDNLARADGYADLAGNAGIGRVKFIDGGGEIHLIELTDGRS